MLKAYRSGRGFSLIELVVVLAILATLMLLGIPAMSGFVANSKVRNAAETFYAAVLRARGEAIHLNQQVDLVLTNDVPTSANVLALTSSPTGQNWAIRAPGLSQLIDAKTAQEGGSTNAVAVNGNGVSVISFNGLGANISGANASIQFTHQTINTNCSLTGAVRCLTVLVNAGGQARLCEPGVAAPDARSC